MDEVCRTPVVKTTINNFMKELDLYHHGIPNGKNSIMLIL